MTKTVSGIRSSARKDSAARLISDVHLTSEEFMAGRARIAAFAKEFPMPASAVKAQSGLGGLAKTVIALGVVGALGGILALALRFF